VAELRVSCVCEPAYNSVASPRQVRNSPEGPLVSRETLPRHAQPSCKQHSRSSTWSMTSRFGVARGASELHTALQKLHMEHDVTLWCG
jgi:hypothetical protein